MTHIEFISDIASKVAEGSRFCVNFEKRTLRVNGKLADLSEVNVLPVSDDILFSTLEGLYVDYKFSAPSERSESHRKCYFKALPEVSLPNSAMLYGERREVARCRLELYVLLMIVSGQLTWHSEWGSWFWQSSIDRDLVILRKWIEPQPLSSD